MFECCFLKKIKNWFKLKKSDLNLKDPIFLFKLQPCSLLLLPSDHVFKHPEPTINNYTMTAYPLQYFSTSHYQISKLDAKGFK